MKTYQIHFIRHGIIDGNLKGQYIGSTDSPLCPLGIEKLRQLEQEYDYPGAAAFFSSPMLRCQQTMEILYPDAKLIVIDALRECCFGEFEGHTADELKEHDIFNEWIAGGGVDAPPGGESAQQFAARVCEAFEMIVAGMMKTGTPSAVICTHAGVIMHILARYGIPEAPMTDWTMDNGCGYSVRIHPQLWTSGGVFEVYDFVPPQPQNDEDEDFFGDGYLMQYGFDDEDAE